MISFVKNVFGTFLKIEVLIQNQALMELIVSKQHQIAMLTFNRPKVFNSFNTQLCRLMQSALDDCASDSNIRCVVLTGAGKAFCAGQDLGEVTGDNPPMFKAILDDGYNPIILKIRALEKPVIAAVNGVAAGAGANIALACDLVFAAESASFIQAFSKIGLIPDNGGTFILPRLVGWQRATALMMTGEKVSALDAEKMGMIYKAIPDATFQATVDKFAQNLAQMPTKTLGIIKRALNVSVTNDLKTQLSMETTWQGEAASTEDFREGVNAFIQKRTAQFKGS
jgi:2-(1,2-epoxy-1,2-dihydrophenyl)acetyl-CoA isomerase